MARGRKAKKVRAYKPRAKNVVCERQFPECPEEPNPIECKECPLYKPKKVLTKEENEQLKSTEPEIEADEDVDLSYEEEKFEVEEEPEEPAGVEEEKLEKIEEPKIEPISLEKEEKKKKKKEEDELEKATRPDDNQ